MNAQIIIICGSEKDFPFAETKIVAPLAEQGLVVEIFAASAHKEPQKVLEILERFSKDQKVVFITVAGRSNALSGFVAANCKNVTIACPPFKDLQEYHTDIHSTLRMPSNTPVLTVVDPGNCVLAVSRIIHGFSN